RLGCAEELRPRRRGRLAAVPHHRGHRPAQLRHHATHRLGRHGPGHLAPSSAWSQQRRCAMSLSVPMIRQTAGPGAARAAGRARGLGGPNRRPGWVSYTLLGVVLALSFYPIYYSFLLASSDSATIAQNP